MKFENKYFIFDSPVKFTFKGLIKSAIRPFLNFYYHILLLFFRNNEKKYKYYVSICCIFKNEAKYLKEWIEYNTIAGVDHFYLYNNNSEDQYLQVLEPYINKGIVTLLNWEKNQAQMECYIDGIHRYKDETKWLGFIDVDEFIVPNSTNSIKDFLRKFENMPAVMIFWKMFCSAGMISRNVENFVTEDFTVSWGKYSDIGKCFYNTSFDFDEKYKMNKMLHHSMWAGCKGIHFPPVNEFGKLCIGNNRSICYRTDPLNFPVQINHYFTKSFAEYSDKKAKGDVYFSKNPHDLDYFYYHDMKCQFTDYHAYKYLIKLKIILSKNK